MTIRRASTQWSAPRALVLVLFALVGCGGADLSPDVPAHRPSDGLLVDPALQAVVELQIGRDGSALAALLDDERAEVRARAALALASVQDTTAVPALTEALGDADAGVRRDAAFALGQAGAAGAVPTLVEVFAREEDRDVRLRILEALGKLSSIESATSLLALDVRSDEEAALSLALARLGAVGGVATEESQSFLLARLDHRDADVRAAAAYYFGRMPIAGPWSPHAPRVRQALDGYGHGAAEAMYLVQALGKLAAPEDASRLREWLARADDWRVRANAAVALGSLPPDPTNRERLIDALDDPMALVGDQAAQGLTRGDPLPSELPRLEAWIDAHPDRRPAAAPLLSLLARADEREFVFGWLDDLALDDVTGWSAGLPALGFMPGQEAVERLLRAAESPDPRIQGPAISALVQRWGQDRFFDQNRAPYFKVFSEALRSGNLQAATRAAGALADPAFVPLGSVAVLTEALDSMEEPRDLEAIMAVRNALADLGGDEAPAASEPSTAEAEGASDSAGSVSPPTVDWSYLAALGVAPRWVLETTRGTITVRLVPEEAPLTVQTLARFTEEGRYDGVLFHRVVPNFVAQAGDFTSRDGWGGPGFTIRSEFTEVRYLRGSVGMASAGKDTEGSQFFVTHSMQPHLDGSYTTFGWVVDGMDVVDRLDVGDRIIRATIEPGG